MKNNQFNTRAKILMYFIFTMITLLQQEQFSKIYAKTHILFQVFTVFIWQDFFEYQAVTSNAAAGLLFYLCLPFIFCIKFNFAFY